MIKDTNEDNLIKFAEEMPEKEKHPELCPWKLLTVDDDRDVHFLTKLVLRDFSFEGRKLEFLSAFSGEEAKEMIREHPDTAVIILDVVMENDNSGLDVVKFIRDEEKNLKIRIILRTGQPGIAPEQEVVSNYDINDYKTKTELTAQKLSTTIISALRAYRDILAIDKSRVNLKRIIKSMGSLFEPRSFAEFANGVMSQLLSLLHLDNDSMFIQLSGFSSKKDGREMQILAATGKWEKYTGQSPEKVLSPEIMALIIKTAEQRESRLTPDHYLGHFRTRNGTENLLYISGNLSPETFDRDLIKLFIDSVANASDNLFIRNRNLENRELMITILCDVIETHSGETGNHTARISAMVSLLASLAGMNKDEIELLRHASPLHDLGKIAMPDAILKKPGKLSPEEFEIMKTHSSLGYGILKRFNRGLMQAAAIISDQHHENWDGTGYPQGAKEQEINILGRITRLADAFESMTHNRVYREALPLDEVLEYIKKERGKSFDPELTDLFLENKESFIEILNRFPEVSGTKRLFSS